MREALPKLSIGIPVYNVEKYIAQCAYSLFNQSYPNIEYIFVDDGSSDNSVNILKSVVGKYPNLDVKIIRLTANQGLSNARIVAVSEMTGELCTFCDSDDWIGDAAFDSVIDTLLRKNADLVVTPFLFSKDGKNTLITASQSTFNSINNMPIDVLHFSLCNKIFRRDIIEKYNLFTTKSLNCWEDLSVSSKYMAFADNIVFVDSPYYYYRDNSQNSLTSQGHKKRLVEQVEVAKDLTKWFEQNGRDFCAKYEQFINHMQFASKIKMLRGKDKNVAEWKRTFPKSNKNILSYHFLKIHYRLMFWLVEKLPTGITQSVANVSKILYK